MGKKHKPRSGSLAYYPKKRAKRQIPSFRSVSKKGDKIKPQNFLGYKVGMTQVIGKDTHQKGTTFGQEIVVPSTIIETPPMRIFGIRAYEKTTDGLKAIADIFYEKTSRHLLKRLVNFKKKTSKKKDEKKTEKKEKTVSDIEKMLPDIFEIRLLAHTQPDLTTMGKKIPDISEVFLNGSVNEQLAYAREKLGKEISVEEVFNEKEFVDVKSVTIGKGIQGVIKRFGVKTHRPKAKKPRVVGSIGPWNPSTVMWTVARAGQLGYQTRTEYNKRILKIGKNPEDVNAKGGFKNYGVIKGPFVMLGGSVPGPAKRIIGLRSNMRKANVQRDAIAEIEQIATKGELR